MTSPDLEINQSATIPHKMTSPDLEITTDHDRVIRCWYLLRAELTSRSTSIVRHYAECSRLPRVPTTVCSDPSQTWHIRWKKAHCNQHFTTKWTKTTLIWVYNDVPPQHLYHAIEQHLTIFLLIICISPQRSKDRVLYRSSKHIW